ncbi:MAG: heavy-metal-associated domain-containing protein [Hoylesella buccalis]
MEKKIFKVNGMACDHCKAKVERTLSCLKGVDSAEVDLANHTVAVNYDEELVKPAHMKKAVDEAGYEFQV